MSLSDPIADALTIIRNARRARQASTEIKRSKLAAAITDVLKRERFIFDYKVLEDKRQGRIRIYFRAPEGLESRPVRPIIDIQRVSRPGLRVYTNAGEIPRILNGLGTCVVSTSRGVMTGKEARRRRVGGEVLLKVW